MNRAAEVLKRRPYCHFRRLDVYVGSGSENGMPRYYILYERIPRDGNKLLTVIGSVKAIRSTLKNFAARTSNKIVVVDLVSSKIVATANAPR